LSLGANPSIDSSFPVVKDCHYNPLVSGAEMGEHEEC
jgi:hypothetical protein